MFREVVSEVLLDSGELLFAFTGASVGQELLVWLLFSLCILLNRKALLSERELLYLTSVGRITTG